MVRGSSEIEGADARHTFHWKDDDKIDIVMWRIPRNIKWNDNIVVREDEYAIFLRDGKILKIFDRAGRYAITTQNVPILATLGAALTGVRQLGEVYYLQRRELRGKFGTIEPLTFKDPDFGIVRIRAFGDFSYQVKDPSLFISQFVGTQGYTTSDKFFDWIKNQLVNILNDSLGKLIKNKKISILDAPSYLQELEQFILEKTLSHLSRYGLEIKKIASLNLTLPDEVTQAIDKKGAMTTLEVDYIQYQTGKAIEGVGEGAATGGSGDGAGNFAGMGAGFGVGMGMAKIMSENMTQKDTTASQSADMQGIKCPECGNTIPINSKFCLNCGNKMIIDCPECNTDVTILTKFCPNCGYEFNS